MEDNIFKILNYNYIIKKIIALSTKGTSTTCSATIKPQMKAPE
jgi:hypothetical protein